MFESIVAFAGGVALFLLGMRLMTDGLKFAAGPALRGLLARATGSRWRAFGSGLLVTALVQSSGAVMFATIGFVNAGLLGLPQAIGLVFGANVGTTLTAWIVALVGFNVDLQALAMPAVALGVALWLGRRGQSASFGQALAGFGVFFLGLDALKDLFVDVGDGIGELGHLGDGLPQRLLFAAIGVVLTVLMQSSSAALAVTLTAAAGGVLPLGAAAAVVIGTNLGTTSIGVFASFRATIAARRTAIAHVVFNLVLVAVALPLLPWLLAGSVRLLGGLVGAAPIATVLAVLHTIANLLTVALLWPLNRALVAALERWVGRREVDPAAPVYLDRHVLGTAHLAVEALRRELVRVGQFAHRMARTSLSSETADAERLQQDHDLVERLGEAAIAFAGGVESGREHGIDEALTSAVRVVQYFRAMAERAIDMARIVPIAGAPAGLDAQLLALRQAADRALEAADPSAERSEPAAIEAATAEFEAAYQRCKGELLRVGSRAELSPAALVRALDRASALRRIVDQAGKAGRFMARIAPPPRTGGRGESNLD